MPIRYRNLGGSKRLADIVFAGSHDASITSGSSNAKTQSLDIMGQARAGVRLFDLRILAQKTAHGAMHVGYHGIKSKKGTGNYTSKITGRTHELKTTKAINGEFGLRLVDMLKDGRNFVSDTGEFLIFKFDKCSNYEVIAEYCVDILGDSIYKPNGKEFGKLTLDDLMGKVVCVFNQGALSEVRYKESDGILGFRAIGGTSGVTKSYDPAFSGLQYYGKGGTNPKKIYQTNNMKMKDNESIQRKMLLAMARQEDHWAANVLGMMYWTSTGLTSNIRCRNEETMWGPTGVPRMGQLWRQGLEASISTQLQRDKIKSRMHGGSRKMKAYFPNIVMIDFADKSKCKTIYKLNEVVEDRLSDAYKQYVGEV